MNPPSKIKPYEDDSGDDSDDKPNKRSGRRKIKIEYIEDKNRRHITFSKRKAGIMKKAYELSTLTGTQVLLLVVSETGLVYTFTTVKLQPIVTKPEGKNLIQACLNAPDPNTTEQESHTAIEASSPRSNHMEEKNEVSPSSSTGYNNNAAPAYPSSYPAGQTPGMSGNGYPSYPGYQQQQQPPPPPPHHHPHQSSAGNSNQPPYGMPYYGQHNQQQQYMSSSNQHQDYWTKQEADGKRDNK
ncbi:uncharacterized protein BX664DRAFT_339506 [Halteromyces radiatus]|uniref:uncharacterized protein n=1 Tax=Halteromyces radiatus TaxID=101107 RepID=UPI00221F89CF|nr:uncharacterized protein BX664DRAFT_339506 [Halteromyces radiatus]KAI8082963.1 hypothetical protein BX664DRAFT_339506 [Halteromyces radiatus]